MHAPVRLKVMLLLTTAAAMGAILAQIAAWCLPGHWWTGPLMAAAVAIALAPAGHRAIATPLRFLLHDARRTSRMDRPMPGRRSRLMRRRDEIGELARLIHQMSIRSHRHGAAANRLRRTLDRQVAESTRKAIQHLKQLAMRDALTNLGNRRFLDEHLPPLVESCLKSRTELICVAMDLDRFKSVNDLLGHATGDRLLELLGQLIQANARREDYGIRLGGDEFIVLMPGGTTHRARQFVDRVSSLFRQYVRNVMPIPLDVDVSAGIACLAADRTRDGGRLLETADRRLYAAKEQRRPSAGAVAEPS